MQRANPLRTTLSGPMDQNRVHKTSAVEKPANPYEHSSKTWWIGLRPICPVYGLCEGVKCENRLHKILTESSIQQKNPRNVVRMTRKWLVPEQPKILSKVIDLFESKLGSERPFLRWSTHPSQYQS